MTWDDLVAWGVVADVDTSAPVHVDVEGSGGVEAVVYATTVEDGKVVLLARRIDS